MSSPRSTARSSFRAMCGGGISSTGSTWMWFGRTCIGERIRTARSEGWGQYREVKMWRDRYSSCHFISFYANHRRRWKEYMVQEFEAELRNRDDRHRRLQITVRGGGEGSGQESNHSSRDRRFSASSIFRPRQSSSGSNSSSSSTSPRSGIDIRYLGFQFTRMDRNRTASDGESHSAPAAPLGGYVRIILMKLGPLQTIRGLLTDGISPTTRTPSLGCRFRPTTSSCHRHT